MRYLSHLCKQSSRFTEGLLGGLLDLSSQIKSNPMELPPMSIPAKFEIDILVNKINQEEHFHAYINQIGGYDIETIFGSFALILGNYELFVNQLTKAKEYDYSRKMECKNYLDQVAIELRNVSRYLKEENNRKSEEYEYINYLLIIYTECVEENPTDLFQFREAVFKPLLLFF